MIATYGKYIYAVILLYVACLVFIPRYHQPAALFWDENYHIPSAQKYLDGIMYMEPHPPLGKLLIALGERMLQPNAGIPAEAFSDFRNADYIKDVPESFSFAGFRLFPVIFAVLNVVLFYFIFLVLSGKPLFSFLCSFLYLYNNALVVHFRGAMLDGIQLFFVLGLVLFWLVQSKRKERICWHTYMVGGVIAGLALSVKLNSAIILPLFLLIYGYEAQDALFDGYRAKRYARLVPVIAKGLGRAVIALSAMVGVFFFIFYIHCSQGRSVGTNTYKASPEYLKIIDQGGTGRWDSFPVMMRDQWAYMSHYHKYVPPVDENGSRPLEWVFMRKCINYRWERNGQHTKYLYLVGNPLVWSAAILGVVLSLFLVVVRYIFPSRIKHRQLIHYMTVFLFLYMAYMWVMSQIDRVMYLYHYFIPLHFALILFALVLLHLFRAGLERGSRKVYGALFILLFWLGQNFVYYSPLTYYKPISKQQLQERVLSDCWGLVPVE